MDFNGHTTSYNYDVMNRLISKTPDPVLAEPTVSFTYLPTGQRASMTDATGTTTYTYDDRDRLIEKATPQGTLFYTYDPAGNVTSIRSSNAGGTDVQYTWDANNRLQDVIDVHAGTFTYSYDDVGNETGLSYPNGIQKTTTYDTQNRLRTIGYVNGPTTVASYAYALDVTGRRTGVVEHSGRTVAYGYDGLYRLTSEDVSADPNGINGRVDYTYDPVGNRLRRDSTLGPVSDQVFSYNANDQIETVEQYDLNGNLIQDSEGNTYQWDYENRLVRKNGTAHTRVYNGDCVLIGRADGGVATTYLVDDQNPTGYTQVFEERTGSTTTKHVFGKSALALVAIGSSSYLSADGQDSVRLVVNGAGVVVGAIAFDAFGVEATSTGTVRVHLYVGERWDGDLGSVELRARKYRVSTGTFTSMDPMIQRPGSRDANLYLYAQNDPINGRDPTGEFTLVQTVVAVSIAGAIAGLAYGLQYGASKEDGALGIATMQYGLAGFIGGAASGAILGGALFAGPAATFAAMRVGLGRVLAKATLPHAKSATAFAGGVTLGFFSGYSRPDGVVGAVGISNALEVLAADAMVVGFSTRFKDMSTLVPGLALASRLALSHWLQPVGFIAFAFTTGFALGHGIGMLAASGFESSGESPPEPLPGEQ